MRCWWNQTTQCKIGGVLVEITYQIKGSHCLHLVQKNCRRLRNDENLDYLREFLVSGAVSTAEDLYGCNPQVKCYHLKLDCLRVDDSGVIRRQTDAGNSERFLAPSHTSLIKIKKRLKRWLKGGYYF